MTDFQIPKGWQTPITIVIALLGVVAIGFSARAIRSAMVTPTPTEIVQLAPTRPRPTVPPTFTATPSPTVPASPTVTPTPSPTATSTPTPAPTPIVVNITELGYLTTVQYKMQTVVADSRATENWWAQVFGSDRVLMRVVGNVQAGIDLSAISEKDVQISGERILLTIPHATISSVELLPDESEMIDSQRKWFFSEYTGLETEVLDTARQELRRWAKNEAGILPVAERLATLQLTEFLQNLGFSTVTITFANEGD